MLPKYRFCGTLPHVRAEQMHRMPAQGTLAVCVAAGPQLRRHHRCEMGKDQGQDREGFRHEQRQQDRQGGHQEHVEALQGGSHPQPSRRRWLRLWFCARPVLRVESPVPLVGWPREFRSCFCSTMHMSLLVLLLFCRQKSLS